MTAVALGAVPLAIELHLNRGSDFQCVLHSTAGDWSATAVISIVVGGATWTATKVGPDATFNVQSTAVDTVIDGDPKTAALWYHDGSLDLLWGKGFVSVNA